MSANQEQIDYWNEKAGPKWVQMQEPLDRTIEHIGLALLDQAAIEAGQRVLDIGCGCGATTLEIARRVGPRGHVLGLDISAPMLDRARQRGEVLGFMQAAFVQADAQTHPFPPESFDLAFSRFGVMFFDDPTAAFANIRRALKPNGRLHFVCWRDIKQNPWMLAPMMAAARHLELPEPPKPDEPGPFSLAEESRIERILKDAGYRNIKIETRDFTAPNDIFGDTKQATDFFMTIGPVAALLEDKDDATRQARTRIAHTNPD